MTKTSTTQHPAVHSNLLTAWGHAVGYGFASGLHPLSPEWSFPPAHNGEQVHGARVAVVSEPPLRDALETPELRLPATDALVTRASRTAIGVRTADCVPVLLYDPASGAVGAVHAGWRGTAKGIVEQTLKTMTKEFGTMMQSLYAVLGPAIGPCCFHVKEDVISAFEKLCRPVHRYAAPEGAGWALDLRALNKHQLLQMGVSPLHIEVIEECTVCHPAHHPSCRRDGAGTGRMYSVIWKRGEG